jgi:aminotransferase
MSSLPLIQQALLRSGKEPLDFLVGVPYYSPDQDLVSGLKQAATELSNQYSTAAGSSELRQLIANLENARGLAVTAENIVIGNGSKSLLFGLLHLLGSEGVIVPTPTYPPMLQQPEILGLKTTILELDEPFLVDEEILKQLPDSSGCLVVGNPANPTGKAYSKEQQNALLNWCRETDTWLIADEVYCDFSWQDEYQSFGEGIENIDKLAIARSFSKSLGICGWRLGYLILPTPEAQRLAQWQLATLNSPSTLIQRAAELYLAEHKIDTAAARQHYEVTAKGIVAIMNQYRFKVVVPDGGYYLFVDLQNHLEQRSGSIEFCQQLAEELGIAIWPGEDFGKPGWARIAFGAVSPANREKMLTDFAARLAQMREDK